MNRTTENRAEYLSLDDLSLGQVFRSGSFHLDDSQIKSFAREYDPQPFHLDDQSAGESFFGGLVASGWHTAAITMRLLVTSMPILGGIVGAGGEITWPRPTKPGDTLHVESEVLEIKPSRSRPDRGLVTVRSVTLNQEGQPVQILVSRLVVPRRQAAQAPIREDNHGDQLS